MNGWRQIIDAARAPTDALLAALRTPEQAQLSLLKSIVDANAQTYFGREHRFAEIGSLDDFRVAVAVRGYEDYLPLIRRIASDERRVLTHADVIAFEETGGTAAGAKLIPYTAASLAGFRAAILPWLGDLARRRPGMMAGSTYASISPATRQPRRTPSGAPVGLESEAAYLGDDLVGAFLSILAVPPEVAAIADVETWRIATLAYLVEREELSFVSVWSPTFILELIGALPTLAERISRRVSAPAARRLAATLSQARFDTTRLWPRLDTISCWADGSSSAFASRLAAQCPQAVIEPKGLLATEAAITLPWGTDAGAIPALTSTFIEFARDDGALRLAHELQVGERYGIIITTHGGLYRYEMGDRVRCVGHEGSVGRVVFEGRGALVSDMVGEKLDEAFVAGVLGNLQVPATLVPRRAPKPHYELWLDGEGHRGAGTRVETGLRTNPQYAYARDIGQLGGIVEVTKPGFSARRNEQLAQEGRRMGDLKHSSLLPGR